MALPTRKKHLLPSLDSFELEENNSDYNEGITLVSDKEEYNDLEEISTEETQTLTDEDFIEEKEPVKIQEEKKEEIIKEREKKESHNKRFKFNIKNLKKIDLNIKKFLNFKNLPKINLDTSSYKIIIGFILFIRSISMLRKIKWFFLLVIVLIISPFLLIFGSFKIKDNRLIKFLKKVILQR